MQDTGAAEAARTAIRKASNLCGGKNKSKQQIPDAQEITTSEAVKSCLAQNRTTMEVIDKTQYKTDPEHAMKQAAAANENIILLNQSPVIFYGNDIEDENLRHTYWLRNKQLKGVTSTLIRFAFPDMYKGITKAVLNNAASRGNQIHDEIQSYAVWGGEAVTECEKTYSKIAAQHQLSTLSTEYLVSDDKMFASAIDMVATSKDCKDNEVILIDIKTTSERHYDSVSLQLSIYAGWFERQNPTLKVKGLYLMWMKPSEEKINPGTPEEKVIYHIDDYRFEELPRVQQSKISSLRAAYLKGNEEYQYTDYPKWLKKRAQAMAKLMTQIETLTAEFDELKADTMQKMTEEHWYTLKANGLNISKVAASQSPKFNTAKYKKEHPDEYEQYVTMTTKKEYITIKKTK